MIKIYSTPSCPYCTMVKEYLGAEGVDYEEFDVASDLDAREELLELTGMASVPVTVHGDIVIVGFNKEKLASILRPQ